MIRAILKKTNMRWWPRRLLSGPEWIVLGVNNLCNLHCKMCDVGTGYENSNFYHHLMGSRPLNMPLPLLRRIIEQTAAYFPEAKLGYAFTEPSIYPHLIESLHNAREHGLYTTMTTNALRLEMQATDLVQAGLRELYVSLDGPPEVHNRIRGHRRSFEKAIAGIEKVLASPPPRPQVSVFCTITPWNAGALLAFAEHFRKLAIQKIGFMHLNFTTPAMVAVHNRRYGASYPAAVSNLSQVPLAALDVARLYDEIQCVKSASLPFPIEFIPALNTPESLHRFYRKPRAFIGSWCYDAFRNVMIKSDGTVIPAHGRCYNIVAGNIYDQNLRDIWNAPVLAEFRHALAQAGGLLPACARCCSAFHH